MKTKRSRFVKLWTEEKKMLGIKTIKLNKVVVVKVSNNNQNTITI